MNLKTNRKVIFKVVSVAVTILFMTLSVSAATGPYLGQKPPGRTPEVFAPGVISVGDSKEHSLSVSPKGDEIFFTRSSGWPYSKIMHIKRQGDKWSMPQVASFLKDNWATQAAFSPDGQYLYYSTSYGKSDIQHFSIWRSRKDGDSWSKPESVIDMGGGMMMEFHPSVTRDGSVYFLYWDFDRQTGDIYVSRLVSGKYAEPVILGPPISTQYNEVRPTVDPNERYLLFESDRPGGYGQTDIYIAFRNKDGTWSSPKNLGPTINTPAKDDVPNISPDGRYWFSSVNGDICWMETPAALLYPNGPIEQPHRSE